MQQIQQILNKIEEEVANRIQQIDEQIKQKKVELEQKYSLIEQQRKKEIEEELNQDLELNKKRVYTENIINYHKKIEEIKNSLFLELINKLKELILNLDKTEYYNLIKSIILKNAFLGEKNNIVFDRTNKLNLEEKRNLLKEVKKQLEKINPTTDLNISEDKNFEIDFGTSIVSDKKSKKFTLDTIIETLRPKLEQKLNEIFKEIVK
ncbi:MAG: hypothetical protein QXO21_01845 [Candidatus Anstonellales archaeon]